MPPKPPQNSRIHAGLGGTCLKSQYWKTGDRQVPEDRWPVCLALLGNSRSMRGPVLKKECGDAEEDTQSCPLAACTSLRHTCVHTHTKSETKSVPISHPVAVWSGHFSTLGNATSVLRCSPLLCVLESWVQLCPIPSGYLIMSKDSWRPDSWWVKVRLAPCNTELSC